MIVGGKVGGLVAVIGDLAHLTEGQAEAAATKTESQCGIENQNAAVDRVRIIGIGRYPMAKSLSAVAGVKI